MLTASVWLLTGYWSVAAAIPPPPSPISLSTSESAAVSAGGVIVRYGGDAKQTVAVVDINATPDAVMKSVMDLPARVRDIGSLSAVDVYAKSGAQVKAKWTMSIAMVKVEFHIAYDCELQSGWCVYALDDSKENDIESSNGSYQAYAHGAGTRLVYRTDSLAAGAPEWERKRLADSSAQEMLGGMKARAEN